MKEERLDRILRAKEYDVISFDIFDTLIYRDVGSPENIFDYISDEAKRRGISIDHFKEKRILAERIVRRNYCENEITLNDIYHFFMVNHKLEKESVETLKEIEIVEEKKHCFSRSKMQTIYENAVGKKRIIITSDMYLEADVIRQILAQAGIRSFDKLYLSSHYGMTKRSGKLFERLIVEENVLPNKIVHIGDNPISDYLSAKKNGLQAILIK